MAKKKDLKDQNPEFVIDIIEILSEKDPSKTNKYLPFMIKQTKSWVDELIGELKENIFKQMFEVIEDFHDLSEKNLLENKDIYSYENNQEIVDTIKLAKERVTKSQVKKLETIVLFEDDDFLVLQPLTTRSSNVYGKSTKWCVASEENDFKKYFKQYTKNGVLIYFIDKRVKEEETRSKPLSKVAFHNDLSNNELTIWDSKDVKLSTTQMMELLSLIPHNVMKTINDKLKEKSNFLLAQERNVKE
jgi:hypothetical protein